MTALELKDGTIIHPVRVTGAGGAIGDGWGVAAPGTPEHEAWKKWASKATAAEERDAREYLRKHRLPGSV